MACSKDAGGYADGSLGTSRVSQAAEVAKEKSDKEVYLTRKQGGFLKR